MCDVSGKVTEMMAFHKGLGPIIEILWKWLDPV